MKNPAICTIVIGILWPVRELFRPRESGVPDNLGNPAPATAPAQPAATPATGKSQLVFDEMSHDFGKIADTTVVEAEFKFTNKGDAPLVFQVPLKATCGCTAGNPRFPKNPNVDQTEFAPGESGFIKASFNPSGKHGDINQRITCNTNDPQQPEQILQIHALVKTTISFDPPLVSFGEVRAGQPATQTIKVNGPAPDFKVNYVSLSKGRYMTVKVVDTKPVTIDGEPMNQSTLELTFNGNAPRGTLQAISTVRTNNDKYPLADFQVMAEVVGDLQVLPPRVNVGIVDGGQPFTKVLRVNSRSGKPFKITKVDQKSTLASPLEVNVTPVEPGNESSYQIEVKGVAPASSAPITATLTLNTDNATDRAIEVQINGAVRPPAPPTQAQQQLQPPVAPQGPGALPHGLSPAADRPEAPKSDTPKTDAPR